MDQIQYILSESNINKEFTYPYLNVYSFKMFNRIIIININNNLWVRFDDIEKYFLNYYNTNLLDFVINMDSNNIKYLEQLAEVPFWDSNTDIYIHELEFQVLMSYSGISNLSETFDFLHNIRIHKINKILKNNIIKNNIINLIKSEYTCSIEINNDNNYIITQYNKKFTIKCLETNKILIFLVI